MAESTVQTPYKTAVSISNSVPTWINTYDRERYAAYSVYDDMYKNVEGTYQLVTRGAENKPVYVPTSRMVVKTINRYTAVSPKLKITGPSDAAVATAQMSFDALFRRERFWSKFAGNKLQGIRRGDWLWHVRADPLKEQGSRISIYAVDPRNFFKIFDPDDVDRVVGCMIIEQIVLNDKTLIKKQQYTKGPDPLNAPDANDGKIWSSLSLWDPEKWEDPTKSPEQILMPPTPLPDLITQLPVYHIPHDEEPGDPWGVSVLQGYERIMSEIVQSTSDESLALALEGLGMYATTSGPPRDEKTGQVVPWRLGPGRVVEIPTGTEFDRVDGIGSVAPYQSHLEFLINHGIKETAGITDAAIGKVDASVAESGIALALQLAPTLAQTETNDTTIKEIHDQFFYDLVNAWFPAYEQTTFEAGTTVEITFGSKIPPNRTVMVAELEAMFAAGIIDAAFYREKMAGLGYSFPEDMGLRVAQERAEMLAATADPALGRAEGELAEPAV